MMISTLNFYELIVTIFNPQNGTSYGNEHRITFNISNLVDPLRDTTNHFLLTSSIVLTGLDLFYFYSLYVHTLFSQLVTVGFK